jgi:CHAD domain-containing protein
MLSKEKMLDYCDKRWEGIAVQLKILSETKDPEAIHKLRLEVKKIRALSVLLREISGNVKLFSTKSLKSVFQLAGRIRLAELNLKILSDFNFSQPALEEDEKKLAALGYELIKARSEAFLEETRSGKKPFTNSIRDIKNNVLRSWFNKSFNDLSIFFLWPVQKEGLHEKRKNIKELNAIFKICPNNLVKELNPDQHYLDNLQELIGQWHDLSVFSNMILSLGLTEDPGYACLKTKEKELFETVLKEATGFDLKIKNPGK